jgi:hypothetical protein
VGLREREKVDVVIGKKERGSSVDVPMRSSPPGMSSLLGAWASRGVSGGVSMPFSRGTSSILLGLSSSLLGAVVSVVVTGAVGDDGTGTGWPPPKK